MGIAETKAVEEGIKMVGGDVKAEFLVVFLSSATQRLQGQQNCNKH